jgi:hypothetical protein
MRLDSINGWHRADDGCREPAVCFEKSLRKG